jgi:scyllo-inositol 2-dehydrogenase (NADP+)
MPSFSKPQDITVAVIGYGGAFNMGKHHLDLMKAAGMTPLAVVELDPARLEVAKKDFPGIETYGTVEEMLKTSKANLVTLITPHNTHAPLALACLAAGKHVVCEKPFAITTDECDRMIAAAKAKGLMVSTFHNRHWDGCILKAVELNDAGAFGEIVRVDAHMGGHGQPGDWWRTSKSISGGILYDWGVHLLEYSLQLVKSDLIEVSGFAKRGFWAAKSKWGADTNEDEGYLVARFVSGAWVSVMISSIDANPRRGFLDITGTKASMLVDWGGYELTTPGPGETIVTKGKFPDGRGDLYYKNVADHLVKGVPLVITPEWARRPIHILDLAGQSAATGRSLPALYK